MQKQHWDPLFAWLRDEYDVELQVAEGFSPARQSEETTERLRGAVEKMDSWELAGQSPPSSSPLTLYHLSSNSSSRFFGEAGSLRGHQADEN
jgi:hypothetical protein